MGILIVADKYKDYFTASEVVSAMERGLRKACPGAQIEAFPLADGGEGSLDAWLRLENGTLQEAEALDPLFRPVKARYGFSQDGKTAFVEMAVVSGLERLVPEERRCMDTSTFGTGQLILHALDRGAERIILAVGGSATVDGGTGMASALGFLFFDEKRREIRSTGGQLLRIHSIEKGSSHPRLGVVDFEVWTDVGIPLCGPRGAAFTFAPQKGASDQEVPMLDKGLWRLSQLLQTEGDFPGAGAAGGLAYGAVAFLQAKVLPGAEQFLSYPVIAQAFARAGHIFTGEGKLDSQTRHGKLVSAVCRRAALRNTPVIALCGAVEASFQEIDAIGLRAAFSVIRKPGLSAGTLGDLEETACQVGRLL